jgi:alkylhydroperoxidase family enzyme
MTKQRRRHGWIETIGPEQATGLLARLYAEAIGRAGKVFDVLRIQSLRPDVLRTGVQLYRDIMFGKGALSRAQRELLAVVVSRANACEY